jgi:outer membrane lipoprotein SlyB
MAFTSRLTLWVAGAATVLAGCATRPLVPDVAVMPPPGKPFEVFQAEEQSCRSYARDQVGQDPQLVAQNKVVSGAAAGAAIGAVAGALLGHGRDEAVATGAGIGVIEGSAVGVGAANRSGANLQRQYDIAYEQCMYAKGNQLPSYRGRAYASPPQTVVVVPAQVTLPVGSGYPPPPPR